MSITEMPIFQPIESFLFAPLAAKRLPVTFSLTAAAGRGNKPLLITFPRASLLLSGVESKTSPPHVRQLTVDVHEKIEQRIGHWG
jgi:hypothetical protein